MVDVSSPLMLVEEELPARLKGKLKLELHSDPYRLRSLLVYRNGDEAFSCEVEFKGERCLIPEWFLAHLCTVPVEG